MKEIKDERTIHDICMEIIGGCALEGKLPTLDTQHSGHEVILTTDRRAQRSKNKYVCPQNLLQELERKSYELGLTVGDDLYNIEGDHISIETDIKSGCYRIVHTVAGEDEKTFMQIERGIIDTLSREESTVAYAKSIAVAKKQEEHER